MIANAHQQAKLAGALTTSSTMGDFELSLGRHQHHAGHVPRHRLTHDVYLLHHI